MITLAITSCNRPELLERTLTSFFQFADLKKYIVDAVVRDDSTVTGCNDRLKDKFPQVRFLYGKERLGLMGNVNELYKEVHTAYIFHCEDDWVFNRTGFIEESHMLLVHDPRLFSVWLRRHDDLNGHPVGRTIHEYDGIKYRYVQTGYQGIWHGYSTNPGLRRKKDAPDFVEALKGVELKGWADGEAFMNEYYFDKGFRSVILENPAVEHIGQNHSTIGNKY